MEPEPELIQQLKAQLIEQLNLAEMKPEDIDTGQPLFNEGLGLDSIDALEIMVLLEKQYGIDTKNIPNLKSVFHSVGTLAAFVAENRKK